MFTWKQVQIASLKECDKLLIHKVIKKQKVVTLDHLFANLKIKYYEKITMQK